MVNFKSIKDKDDDLVVVAGNLAMLITPYRKGQVPASLTDASGALQALSTDWSSVGELEKKAGAKISPNMKTTDIEGYGSMQARRSIKTAEAVEISVTPQEARRLNLAMYWSLDEDDFDVDPASGETRAYKSGTAKMKYWSVILIGHDEDNAAGDIYPFWIFPKMTVTKSDSINLSNEDAATLPLTLTAYEDSTFGPDGSYVALGWAGPGAKALNAAAGFVAGS